MLRQATRSRRRVRFVRAIACAFALAVLRAAQAHYFCVDTAQQLQDALDAVSDGGIYVNEDDVIEVVQGTYRTGAATGNAAFHSNASASTNKLTIYGGFSTGCSGSDRFPAASTILDGHGISGVMLLRRPSGAIAVTHLTFQNGASDLGAGLQINHLAAVSAAVNLDHLILRDNHASADAGGLYASGASGPGYDAVYMNNVLFSGNRADDNYGAAYVTAYSQYGLISHVTIHDNHSPAGTVGGLYCGGNHACQIEDSIAWGNTNFGLYFDAPSNTLVCTDYGTLGGTAPGYAANNLSVAPGFVDTGGDYHLAGDSPLLARCGPDFTTDLDEHAYPHSGRSDMGAYEETIFHDDFDAN